MNARAPRLTSPGLYIVFCVGATEAKCAGKTEEVEKTGNKMMHERICSTPRLLPLAPVKPVPTIGG